MKHMHTNIQLTAVELRRFVTPALAEDKLRLIQDAQQELQMLLAHLAQVTAAIHRQEFIAASADLGQAQTHGTALQAVLYGLAHDQQERNGSIYNTLTSKDELIQVYGRALLLCTRMRHLRIGAPAPVEQLLAEFRALLDPLNFAVADVERLQHSH